MVVRCASLEPWAQAADALMRGGGRALPSYLVVSEKRRRTDVRWWNWSRERSFRSDSIFNFHRPAKNVSNEAPQNRHIQEYNK